MSPLGDHKLRQEKTEMDTSQGDLDKMLDSGGTRSGRGQLKKGYLGGGMPRPSPNLGTRRLHDDDDEGLMTRTGTVPGTASQHSCLRRYNLNTRKGKRRISRG